MPWPGPSEIMTATRDRAHRHISAVDQGYSPSRCFRLKVTILRGVCQALGELKHQWHRNEFEAGMAWNQEIAVSARYCGRRWASEERHGVCGVAVLAAIVAPPVAPMTVVAAITVLNVNK